MNRKAISESVNVAAVVALVIVAIPVVFGLVFFYRIAAFAAVGAGLLGVAVAVVASPTFRGRVRAMVDPELEYKGMRLATEVLLGPGHVWARVERDGAFLGVDDLAGKCLGPIDRIELPLPGQRIHKGEPLFTVAHKNRFISSRSPFESTVVAANERLRKDPQRLNRDPYGLGWVVRVRNEEPGREKRRMLRGTDAKAWFRREVDHLVALVGNNDGSSVSMADGGVIAAGLDQMIDESTWQRVHAELFEQAVTRKEMES